MSKKHFWHYDNHKIVSFADNGYSLQFSAMFITAVNFYLAAQFLFMKYTATVDTPINAMPQQGECAIRWKEQTIALCNKRKDVAPCNYTW